MKTFVEFLQEEHPDFNEGFSQNLAFGTALLSPWTASAAPLAKPADTVAIHQYHGTLASPFHLDVNEFNDKFPTDGVIETISENKEEKSKQIKVSLPISKNIYKIVKTQKFNDYMYNVIAKKLNIVPDKNHLSITPIGNYVFYYKLGSERTSSGGDFGIVVLVEVRVK